MTVHLSEIFEDFNQLTEKLDEIPKSAKMKTQKLLDVFFNEKTDIFKEPRAFLEAINNLSEEVGHAYHTVLAIELARQRITPQKASELINLLPKQLTPSQPVVLQPTAPQLGVLSGYWYYKAAREIAKASTGKNGEQPFTPQISTSKEVIDILEFGRQLIPEFNRVQEYFQKCVDHLYFFNDLDTRERFLSELRKHLNKIAGIIRVFCRTIAEYRKELIGERKRDIAKAVIALEMVRQTGETLPLDPMARKLMEQAGRT